MLEKLRLSKLWFFIAILLVGIVNANVQSQWQNYSFYTCQLTTTGSGANTLIGYNAVPLSQINMSSIFCTVSGNFPIYPIILLLVVYVIAGFIFSFMEGMRLFTLVAAVGFIFSTILWNYGLLGGPIWAFSLGFLIFMLLIHYLQSR